MASDFDRNAFIAGLQQARAGLDEAAALGRRLAGEIDRIYLVGCGAPNRVMLGLDYWIQHYSPHLEVRRYFPAEFVAQNPPRCDGRTLVLLGSKSGTTPETVQAAAFLRDRPCRTVAVTQTAQLPLAQAVQHPLLMGETAQAHAGMFMLMQALVGGLLAAKDGWPLQEKLLASLHALPEVLAEETAANDARNAEYARLYKDDKVLYHVAAGPMFSAAYVFGVCMVMEMLLLHSTALEAAEFFHGPFEVVDRNTPLLLLLGEYPSRPLMERVGRFCKKYTERLIICDTRDFAMAGVAPEIRPIVCPYVMDAALHRLAEHLSVWLGKPLSTRRYMWKTEY
jgi:fructoselysine 6-phosphate deglycase